MAEARFGLVDPQERDLVLVRLDEGVKYIVDLLPEKTKEKLKIRDHESIQESTHLLFNEFIIALNSTD